MKAPRPEGDVAQAKKGDENELTARERVFVQLVADPIDTRSVGEKAQAAGWKEPRYGYRVAARPRVAAAIERAVADNIRTLRARVSRVLSVLATKAEGGDVRAAALYLEACGVIGSRGVSVSVTSTAEHRVMGFPERLQRLIDERREKLIEAGYLVRSPTVAQGPGDSQSAGDGVTTLLDASTCSDDSLPVLHGSTTEVSDEAQ